MKKLFLLPGTIGTYVDDICNPKIIIYIDQIETPFKGKQFVIKPESGWKFGFVGNYDSPEDILRFLGYEIEKDITKKNFTEELNYSIYYACNLIRISWLSYALGMVKTKEKGGMSELAKVDKYSVIYLLISNYEWEKLFKNTEWLEILSAVQNINSLVEPKVERNIIYKQMNLIIENFKNETAGFICTSPI